MTSETDKPHFYTQIHLGSPGEDIDRQHLQEIKHRFKHLSQLREQRIQASLQPDQLVFFELLPLLFHCNLPMLPGFISENTPAGIPEYKVSIQTLNAAKKYATKFDYREGASLHVYPIEGLFLAGSISSIAYSKTSIIEIWCCYQTGLPVTAIDELQKKASAIEDWAASLRLKVHCRLIDSKKFRHGNTQLSTESNGQSQYLLLEEFYRTAIYIAGKSPAWWLVPPHEEGNYANYIGHLIDNRFIRESELIDFGGLGPVPAEELVSVTFGLLYESLSVPYQPLLKLLLMEYYVSEFPQIKWPCYGIKKAVYHGNFILADLDPYFLMYRKVEKYLKTKFSTKKSVLAKQSFYFTVIDPSDQIRASNIKYMHSIAKEWNWHESIMDDLKRSSRNISNAILEHTVILEQLTRSYQMIMEFARTHSNTNLISSDTLKLIRRKLQVFLEKKPDKIEILSTRAEVYAKENTLSIVENCLPEGISEWFLYLYSQANTADSIPLQKCRTLIGVLCWLIVNGLYHRDLQLNISSPSTKISNLELYAIARETNLFITQNFNYDAALDAYQSASLTLNTLVIINVAAPFDEIRTVMSERSDALSYGKDRQCFIKTIDRVSLSSWGELTTRQSEGLTGLFDCFTDIINNNNKQKPFPLKNLKFLCYSPKRARCILFRVEVVFSILAKLFSKPQDQGSPRYILPGGTAYYIFQANHKILSYQELATEQLLLNALASPQEQFSVTYFDQAVLDNTPITHIYSLNRAKVIQLFYYENNGDTSIYIIDEKGALYTKTHSKTIAIHLLKKYSIFLESINNRNLFDKGLAIEYYQIEKNATDVFSSKPVRLQVSPSNNALSLRITGEDTNKGIIYTIYCNEKEFSSLDHGNRVFQAAYQYILQIRDNRMDYPIHISDIDMPISVFHIENQGQLQTIHYLKFKEKIEDKFNS